MSVKTRKSGPDLVPGWFADTAEGNFEIGIDEDEMHSGSASAYLQSVARRPIDFGNLCQWFDADEFLGKHLKMTAWVKTELRTGKAQLWVRVDGPWTESARRDSFDNMGERPIKGKTDWAPYSIVVDVPHTSTEIYFGIMLIGTGKVWFDDVVIEAVGKDIPVTGEFTSANEPRKRKLQPINMSFGDLK